MRVDLLSIYKFLIHSRFGKKECDELVNNTGN